MPSSLLAPINQCQLTGLERSVLFIAPKGVKIYQDNFKQVRIVKPYVAGVLFSKLSARNYLIREKYIEEKFKNDPILDNLITIMRIWGDCSITDY